MLELEPNKTGMVQRIFYYSVPTVSVRRSQYQRERLADLDAGGGWGPLRARES